MWSATYEVPAELQRWHLRAGTLERCSRHPHVEVTTEELESELTYATCECGRGCGHALGVCRNAFLELCTREDVTPGGVRTLLRLAANTGAFVLCDLDLPQPGRSHRAGVVGRSDLTAEDLTSLAYTDDGMWDAPSLLAHPSADATTARAYLRRCLRLIEEGGVNRVYVDAVVRLAAAALTRMGAAGDGLGEILLTLGEDWEGDVEGLLETAGALSRA